MSLLPIPTPPSLPRPPQADIDAVYPDLAKALVAFPVDTAGHRSAPVDEFIMELEGKAHSTAAIEWAIFSGQRQGWIVETTCKRDRCPSNPHTGITTTRANIVDVPAIAATDAFWNAWKSGSFQSRTKQIVILIHGIRTHANWQPLVRRVLQEIPETRVIPLKYGYFDAFRFWCPLFTRKAPIEDIRREIQNARNENLDAEVSVIAHSFGTYIISQILLENPDLRLKHLVLSGSIIPRPYRWDYIKARIKTPVINDYGTRDIWPVLAQSLSWGYGDTGRHGFGRGAAITDRGHNYKHSDFFNEAFVRKFWHPWFERDEYVSSEWDESAPPSPWWLSILSVLPLQWMFIFAILFFGAYRFWPKPNLDVQPEVLSVPAAQSGADSSPPKPAGRVDRVRLVALASDSGQDFVVRSTAVSELLSDEGTNFTSVLPLIQQLLWETPEDGQKRQQGLALIEDALVPVLPEKSMSVVEEYGFKQRLLREVGQMLADEQTKGSFNIYPEDRVLEALDLRVFEQQVGRITGFWWQVFHRAFLEAEWDRFRGFDDSTWVSRHLDFLPHDLFANFDEPTVRRMCADQRIAISVVGAIQVLGVPNWEPDSNLKRRCENTLISFLDPSHPNDESLSFAAKVFEVTPGNKQIIDLALRLVLDEDGFRRRWSGAAGQRIEGPRGEMDRFTQAAEYLKRHCTVKMHSESVEPRLREFIQMRTREIRDKQLADISFTNDLNGDDRIRTCLEVIFEMNKHNLGLAERHRLNLRLEPATMTAIDELFHLDPKLLNNLSHQKTRWEKMKSASLNP